MAHPGSLKKSIPYSKTLRIKRVCSTFDEYKKLSNETFFHDSWKKDSKNIVQNQIEKVDNLEKSAFLNRTNAVRKTTFGYI